MSSPFVMLVEQRRVYWQLILLPESFERLPCNVVPGHLEW